MRTPLFISLGICGLLMEGCTGESEDSAGSEDSDRDSPAPDTGPEPLSDCSELHWRTESDLLLTNQGQVDEFCFEWNAVEGNLTIDLDGDPDEPIWELDGISCLCEVSGDVEIFWIPDYNPDCSAPPPPHSSTDLEMGLLERVGGDLLVRDIWGLAQLSFMEALVEVGGDFQLYGLDNLAGISLASLSTIGGSFQLTDAVMLQSIELPALTGLGGLELRSESESDLAGLRILSLPELAAVDGDFELDGLRGLFSISADQLVSIAGGFVLRGGCTYEPSFPLIESVGSLELVGNCGIESLDGLPLGEIRSQNAEGDSLQIESNDGLSQAVLDAFVAGLSVTGTGSVAASAAEDGACSTWQNARWKSESEWCSSE